MKQYTTPEQTAKLIELGFEKPRVAMPKFEWKDGEPQFHYTIGELIEIINQIDDEELRISRNDVFWSATTDFYGATNRELVDALYDMIVELKADSVI